MRHAKFLSIVFAAIIAGAMSTMPLNAVAEEHDHEKHEEHGTEEDHGEDHDEQGHDEEGAVRLSKVEMKEFGIETGTAATGKLHTYVEIPGEVKLNADRVAHVTPRSAGVVRKVMKKPGDHVKKGDAMAILVSAEMAQARIEYFQAKIQVETAKIKRDVALAQVEVARAERDLAVSRVEVAQTNRDVATSNKDIKAANFKWQKTIHDNTAKVLTRLKEKTSMDKITREFQNRPIGANRERLLSAYASLNYAKAAYERESELREKKISSESDFLQARKEYGSTESEFEAIYEEVGFQNRISLMEKRQAMEVANQLVKMAEQSVKTAEQSVKVAEQTLRVAEQDAKVAGQNLKVAVSAFHAGELKLYILGLSQKEINRLKRKGDVDSDAALYVMRAPFEGTVIEKHIALGEMLNAEAKAFVIADLASVWVDMNVFKKDLPFVRKGQAVIITTGHDIPDVEGTISWVTPLVGEETRTAVARVILPNPEEVWRPGLFVTGKVATGNTEAGIIVPKTAIQTMENRKFVFVETDEGFEPRPVETGKSDAIHVEIVSGLEAGQKYVAKGGFTLKTQLAKGSFESGHSH